MSENSNFHDEQLPTSPLHDEGVNIAASLRAAEAFARHALRSPESTEQEVVEAVQNLKQAKAVLVEYETKHERGPVQVGKIIEEMVDLETRTIYRQPGTERLQAMRVVEQRLHGIRQARADLIAAVRRGEEVDTHAMEVNGLELADAIAQREQLTQQSEEDQP